MAKGSGGRLIISSGFRIIDQGGGSRDYEGLFGRLTDRLDKRPRSRASPRGVAEKITRVEVEWRIEGQ